MNIVKDSDLFIKKAPISFLNKIVLMVFSYKFLIIFRKLFSIILHLELPNDSYAKRIRLGHPYDIIINQKTRVGFNVTIHQNVTIGSKQFGKKAGVPKIGNNVIIYSHSVILGKITIGEDCIIGAGSIVLNDIPPRSIVAGNPAKIIGKVIFD